MFKRIFTGLMAVAMLITTSCQKQEFAPGQDATVTFEVATPEIATRAYSDGTTATNLQYAVYTKEGKHLEELNGEQTIDGKTSIRLALTIGNEYNVLFWAAAPNAPYNVDLSDATMRVDYTNAVSNDENRDAFYAYVPVKVNQSAQTKNVELKRPFAQLNIGTNDYDLSKKAGYEPTMSYVKVPVYNRLNFANGKVMGEAASVLFDYAAIPSTDAFPVDGYEYLAMNYLLVSADQALVDITFGYYDNSVEDAKTRQVTSVPVKRNYRTNLYGSILTNQVDMNVEINPEYNKPAHEVDALLYAAQNGGTVTLTDHTTLASPLNVQANMVLNMNEDVTLTGSITVASGVDFTVNGGKIVNTNKEVSGITSNGDLTLDGVTIESARHALRIESGNAVIKGGLYKVNPISKSTLHALNVGDNGTVAHVTILGGTFIGPKGTMADSGSAVNVRSGSSVEIEGGDFSGGKNNTLANAGTLTVKGGTFDQEPKASYIADGYKACEGQGIWYVVANDVTVATTNADVKNVFENGGSVILADDITFEKITSIEPGAVVNLNLNGKTITVVENTTSNTLMYVKEGAKLIVDGNGTIDLGDVSTMAIFAPYGELVINNGTFIRNKVTTVTKNTTGLFMGAKITSSNVTINGGYFDPGYYDQNAADIEAILAGEKEFIETADDVAKRGNSKDANLVRTALKDNVSVLLNHAGYGSFKVYGGTFVGANPAWGDEGCMLPTTPNYLRPWSYYQGALLDGQTFHEDGIVLPAGYTITTGTNSDGVPTYTVTYNK